MEGVTIAKQEPVEEKPKKTVVVKEKIIKILDEAQSEELKQWAEELQRMENELNRRKAELDAREEALNKRENEFNEREKEVQKKNNNSEPVRGR